MNSSEIVALVSTLAIVISDQVPNNEELDLLAVVLTQLGDTLATISISRTLQESKNPSPESPIILS